jgi:small GTP-binding protein
MSDLDVIKKIENVIGNKLTVCPPDINIMSWNAAVKRTYLLDDNQQIISLNLVECGLEKIDFLIELKNIIQLNLRGNPRLADITVLEELEMLDELNLEGFSLSDASPLSRLKNLTKLAFTSDNLNCTVFISKLKKLTVLDLYCYELEDITDLKELKKLTHLELSCTLLHDISILDKLREITHLELTENEIRNLNALKDLTKITKLHLGCNHLDDISVLGNLKNLTRLELWSNKLTNVQPLAELHNLTHLNLADNKIDDINALQKLRNLTELDLSGNPINDINVLQDFRHLTYLNLSHTHVKSMPEWMLDFNLDIKWEDGYEIGAIGIFLENDFLEEPPPEIVRLGNEAIKSYFNSGERKAINELKIILVGDGGAGKTSLSKVLRHELFDKNEDQTHGINIFKQSIEGISVNFWDFGGQEMMHSTHQFFLSKRSLYILVLDSREEDKAEYWLKYIESFGGDSPILVALNKIDQHPSFEVNRKALKEKYEGIQGFYKLSCQTQKGLDEFKTALIETFQTVPLIRSKLPVTWFEVKTQLENFSLQENFIDYQTFRKLCEQQKINDVSTQDVLAEYLNDLGVIVHFTNPQLIGTPVLKPRWITQAVYKIINFKSLAEAHGIFCLNDLPKALKKNSENDFNYPPDKYNHIVELMKKFELCYEVDKENLLIPDLLEIQEPEIEFNQREALFFRIRYNFLPRFVMPCFIVKLHQDIEDDLRWRTGVVLRNNMFDARAIVKVDYDEKRISIVVNGSQKRDYFAVIRNTFNEIHKSFEKIGVTELVPLPDFPKYEIEYEELIGYESAGKDDYFIGKLRRNYSVSKLLNGIEKPENRESANHKTVINYGHYHEDSQMSNERTINTVNYVEGSNNGNIAGRDIIQTQTNENGDMKSLLAELLKQIEELKSKSTTENESMLVQINRDAETLASEINSDASRKQWCDLSLDSIKTTAQKIGDIALPIINVAEKLSQLSSFG